MFIDGTHIKANANTKKKIEIEVPVAAKRYADELLDEINNDRQEHGKKPFDNDDTPKTGGKKKNNIKDNLHMKLIPLVIKMDLFLKQ